jgi:hypothetical protein
MPADTAFFRHLPKTAGTSLITTLANVYGEARCHRFTDVADATGPRFSRTVHDGATSPALVSGHVPLSLVAAGGVGEEFTVLREPIARLLSMRRFFERLPAVERERLGFGERITVADMLDAPHPTVRGQVRNGMVRFFCGDHPFADPAAEAFSAPAPPAEAIQAALGALETMTVGFVEDMPAALDAIRRRLRVPYALETPVENATAAAAEEVSVEEVRALVEANGVDLAIFHVLSRRIARLGPPGTARDPGRHDPRTLFDPQPGAHYESAAIPGRQGFEICPVDAPMSWIGPTGCGRIHLAPSPSALSLSIALYPVAPRYPVERVVFRIDGRRWPHTVFHGPANVSFRLAPLPPHAGIVELAILQPAAIPVTIVEQGACDERSLGVALLGIACDDR